MLRRSIPERVWVFDMEWVPDARAAVRLLGLPEDITEAEAFDALWKHGGATEAKPRPFLKYLYSRIVSIAFLSRNVVYTDGQRSLEFKLHSLPKLPVDEAELEEAQIIERFLDFVGHRKPQLVGFNSQESDIQVLIQRGMINEVSAPVFCTRPANKWDAGDYFNRWDNEEHLDLMKLFSGGAMTPRLNEMAKLCGFPGKLDVDGEQVADLWLQRNVTKIVEYNRIDTLNTYLVWLRIAYFCGKLKLEEYAAEQEQFREFLESESEKPNNGFIRTFLDKWEM